MKLPACPPAVAVLACLAMLTGCLGSKSESARQQQTSHLRSLVSLFNFATTKLGHRPADEAEFKAFITKNSQSMLDTLKVASVDELLVSERDGQPFVVLYGTPPAGISNDVVAYERTGVNGRRAVAFTLGMVEEVEPARFDQLVPPASRQKG